MEGLWAATVEREFLVILEKEVVVDNRGVEVGFLGWVDWQWGATAELEFLVFVEEGMVVDNRGFVVGRWGRGRC